MAPAKKTTHSVRVRVREVPYLVKTLNVLDQPQISELVGYGPGQPEIDPVNVLGPDADVESQEYRDAMEDYKMGQLIELMDNDYLRLKAAKAVMDVEEAEVLSVAMDEEVLDVTTASVDELAGWIKTENPSVNEVVQASDGQAELAQKLLEAEAMAKNGEPRKGVVDGLSAVISRG